MALNLNADDFLNWNTKSSALISFSKSHKNTKRNIKLLNARISLLHVYTNVLALTIICSYGI